MRKIILITACLLCILGIVGVLFGFQFVRGQVSAQESKSETPVLIEQSEIVPDKNARSQKKYNELILKAQTSGSVRVIVGLRTDFTLEGDLSPTRRRNQRAEIKRVQNDLLEALGISAAEDIKQFDFIPYMALKVDAVVYSVGIGDDYMQGVNQNTLRQIADRTGGRAFFPRDETDLQRAFDQIQNELRSQYLIAYEPSNSKKDGSYRRIEIQVANPVLEKQRVKLTHRQGYFAESENKK